MIIIEYSPLFGKVLLLLRVVLTSSNVYLGKNVPSNRLRFGLLNDSELCPALVVRSDADLHRQKEPQKLHLQMYVYLVMLDFRSGSFKRLLPCCH